MKIFPYNTGEKDDNRILECESEQEQDLEGQIDGSKMNIDHRLIEERERERERERVSNTLDD